MDSIQTITPNYYSKYRTNFRADDNRQVRDGVVYTEPEILRRSEVRQSQPSYPQPVVQYSQQSNPIDEYNKQKKKNSLKNNIITITGVLASLAIIAGMAVTIKSIRGSKAERATIDALDARIEILKQRKADPAKLREISEERARQPHERSLYRINDLVRLAEQELKQEKSPEIDINKLREMLDKRIIGQEDAKKAIIDQVETIIYNMRNGISDGKPFIIAIDGPPGTAKTTISEVLADVLGMYYKKVPMSSIEKPGSLVGFERTYVGAKGGTIAAAQLEGNTKRVVYALDELEKASPEARNTMLALLDDQAKFKDLYYNCEIDLSQSVFAISTNQLEALKGTPLYDRIKPNLIRVTPYDNKTKAAIGRLKLEKALSKNKMKDKVIVNDEIYDVIAKHTTDAGGRETTQIAENRIITELKKRLNHISDGEKITVDKDFVEKLLSGS